MVAGGGGMMRDLEARGGEESREIAVKDEMRWEAGN